ncbi:MAG: permease [Bacteroidota bacterium]
MEKTLGLLLMIGLGLALQRKIGSKEQLKGLKVLILSLALPATIFVALLNVELSQNMLLFPLAALAINGILLLLASFSRKVFPGLSEQRHRTLMMLIPSFAPGLSCFPFIAEFLGDESVALAALADVGNKFFVLILLYFLAIHWYHRLNEVPKQSNNAKLKQLGMAMVAEPINMVMIVALVMLAFGLNLQSLPETVSGVILRLSGIMAPLILLFIGLAVKLNRQDFGLILRLLLGRAGLLFLISAAVIFLVPSLSVPLMLLIIVFPQSSCSFWPFAHMSAVDAMEDAEGRTFDVNFGLSTLAISLPLSTTLILGVFSFQSVALNPLYLAIFGILLVVGASLPEVMRMVRKSPSLASTDPLNLPEESAATVSKTLVEARH